MPKIKIISKQKMPKVPTSKNLNVEFDRVRPAGGKPPLPLTKSYNRQGDR